MSEALFDKCMFLTDTHFGRAGHSPAASQDMLAFLDWAIDRARSWGAKTLIFGGDWHDSRHSIHLSTLHASLLGMDRLDAAFDRIFWLPGNHDLLYRERRDIASIEFARKFDHIRIIRDPLTLDNVTFLPWLVGDEYKSVRALRSRYVFGHLEMPGFKMNAAVVLPDSPHLVKPDAFLNQEFVFSGHFHIRQTAGRVIYTGNVMPFNFSDNWDEARGIMLLRWGHDPLFEAWPDQPVYRTAKLSELLDTPSRILKPRATIRAMVDIPLHYEEMQQIRDGLVSEYGLRKFEIIPLAAEDVGDQQFKDDRTTFKSVDQMVMDGLLSVESVSIDAARLVEIYRNLVA